MSLYSFQIGMQLFMLPAALLAFWAQAKVKSSYNSYSKILSSKGYTGAEISKSLLAIAGINSVSVERVSGVLTDHFDPRKNVIRLSDGIYGSSSIAAISVAAHETGHAIQHAQGYFPIKIRSALFPIASFGSSLSIPMVMLGFFLGVGRGQLGYILANIGIVLFLFYFLFSLITLPVEFNASARALKMLKENNFVSEGEVNGAKNVLSAAAMTYVASTVQALLQLLYFILKVSGSRDRD